MSGKLRIFSSPEPSPEPKAQWWWVYRIGRPLPSVCECVCVHMSTFSNIFSKTTGPIKVKFHMKPPSDGEQKFVQLVQDTWPRWSPCPYMVKTLKSLLLQNQKADDLETWYSASGAWVLPNSFKWWPWVDLDLFYRKVKFGPLCFCMGKR